ncbi:efflux RND transporter periplasmic adaptor subunit [Ramlibacter sp. AN1015]|uniref:efflux RND transporter periplasmic adaptor subunit n=1 Tax=Ramlibacter sp. AN1015 TaxID=3133428 RepID=UPI0030BAE4DB
MNSKHFIFTAAIAVALGAGGYGLYWLGKREGAAQSAPPQAPPAELSQAARQAAGPPTQSPAPQAVPQTIAEGEEATRRHVAAGIKAGDVDPGTGRKVLYYHDPMVPGNKFDKPGKSPFMDMMLVPVYADGDTDQGKVTVSSRIQQNLGIRIAQVTEGIAAAEVTAVGSIAFNERDQAVVQSRAAGFVERLYVRATLDRVAKGQKLAELYVPDWVAVQEEFLAVRRMQGTDLAGLLDGARARMRQAGMSEEQIRRVDETGRPDARIAVTAPISGLVTEIGLREGMAVMAGTTLFRINGFGSVWANAEVPESQAALVRPGTRVVAQTPAAPGSNFEGRVQTLLPSVDAATRTIRARVELPNPRGQLVPGMFVSMKFSDPRREKAVLVPSEALIYTGKRTVAIVAEESGKFRPVEVQAGLESGNQTEVLRGLQPGQRVVVSAQFLIDSEASLKGVEARLNEPTEAVSNAAAAQQTYRSQATIEELSQDTVTLAHGPIAELKWGSMTMEFKLPPRDKRPPGLKVGDPVAFEFYMEKEGPPQVTSLTMLKKAAASTAGDTTAPRATQRGN